MFIHKKTKHVIEFETLIYETTIKAKAQFDLIKGTFKIVAEVPRELGGEAYKYEEVGEFIDRCYDRAEATLNVLLSDQMDTAISTRNTMNLFSQLQEHGVELIVGDVTPKAAKL